MTKTIEEARREAFEAWYVQHAMAAGVQATITDMAVMRGKDGEYRRYPVLHGKWIGYNAALDSLCIELPFMRYYFGPSGESEMAYEPDDIEQAIHAAGEQCKTSAQLNRRHAIWKGCAFVTGLAVLLAVIGPSLG